MREHSERRRGESQSDFYKVTKGINRQPFAKEKENMTKRRETKNEATWRHSITRTILRMENGETRKKKQRSKERK